MLLQLRLRERRIRPPSFLQLLCEIREEEETQAQRQMFSSSSKTTVRQVNAAKSATEVPPNSSDLVTEIQELKASMAKLKVQGCKPTPNSAQPPEVTDSTCVVNEVQCLRSQVAELTHQLQAMRVSPADS